MLLPLVMHLFFLQTQAPSEPSPPQTAEEAIKSSFKCPQGAHDSGAGSIPGMTVRWCDIQKDGRPVYHGPVWRWYPNGQLDGKEYYLNGDAAGVWPSYYDNGKPSSLGAFKDGRKIATWKYWAEAGYLSSEVTYTGDDDKTIEYYPSGHKKAEGTFVSSGKIGEWTYWAEDGKEKAHCDFGKGVFAVQSISCHTIADELEPKGFSPPIAEAGKETADHIRIRVGSQVYKLTAPVGWMPDIEAGKSEQLPVVFYPQGKHWKDVGANMYVRVCYKNGRSFQQMVTDDKDSFEEDAADYNEISVAKGQLANGVTYIQKSITYHPLVSTDSPFSIVASNVIHEKIAYLNNSSQVVLVLVLTTDSASRLVRSTPAFQGILQSIR